MKRRIASLLYVLPMCAAAQQVLIDDVTPGWQRIADSEPVPLVRASLREGQNACVALAYRVGPDGVPTDFRRLGGHSSVRSPVASEVALGHLADASAAAISQWRYQPLPNAAGGDRTMVAVARSGTGASTAACNKQLPAGVPERVARGLVLLAGSR